jgi:hypothetical protein
MLLNLLFPIQLDTSNDEWKCHHISEGMFSVRSIYRYLAGSIIPPISLEPDLVRDLGFLWKSFAPSKITVFSWQLLLQRLPTKVNLAKRGVVDGEVDLLCALCPMELEKESHLFGDCAFASTLWRKVYNWCGWTDLVPRDLRIIFGKFNVGRSNGKRLKGLLAVWHAVVWYIWKARNDLIFNDKVPVLEDVFQGIILHSWKWLCAKKKGVGCSFYEWITCPLDCILR